MDPATRYPIAVSLQRHTAADIASVLLAVFCSYDIATKCISDNGSNLTYDLWKEVIRILNVEHTFSTIFHPQSQGYVEKLYSTLKRGFKALVDRYQNNWNECLALIRWSYRSSQVEDLTYSLSHCCLVEN